MAAVTQTGTPQRHIIGELVERFYNLSGNNGDTFKPPQQGIRHVVISPTTAIAVGYTLSAAGVITFVSAGAWVAKVGIISREG